MVQSAVTTLLWKGSISDEGSEYLVISYLSVNSGGFSSGLFAAPFQRSQTVFVLYYRVLCVFIWDVCKFRGYYMLYNLQKSSKAHKWILGWYPNSIILLAYK